MNYTKSPTNLYFWTINISLDKEKKNVKKIGSLNGLLWVYFCFMLGGGDERGGGKIYIYIYIGGWRMFTPLHLHARRHMENPPMWRIFTMRHLVSPCLSGLIVLQVLCTLMGGATWLCATCCSILSCSGLCVLALHHPLVLWLSYLVP